MTFILIVIALAFGFYIGHQLGEQDGLKKWRIGAEDHVFKVVEDRIWQEKSFRKAFGVAGARLGDIFPRGRAKHVVIEAEAFLNLVGIREALPSISSGLDSGDIPNVEEIVCQEVEAAYRSYLVDLYQWSDDEYEAKRGSAPPANASPYAPKIGKDYTELS